jgi:hypothetical protein
VDALIFVAVAVAWAVYLIPKAMRHHDEAVRSRSVDRFSRSLRVLARREPVSKRQAKLVVSPDRPVGSTSAPATATVTADAPAGPTVAQARATRESARRAARRRRRVLLVLLTSVAAVAGVAAYGAISWVWVAVPGGLVLAWLLACRLMVRSERRSWQRLVTPEPAAAATEETSDADEDTVTIESAAIAAAMREAGMWDPVPVTLPTYVTKPAATRSVRTIDLEDSGVWTSGNTAADTALAREADEADRQARDASGDANRAVGSAG